jgi:hypothetical protein
MIYAEAVSRRTVPAKLFPIHIPFSPGINQAGTFQTSKGNSAIKCYAGFIYVMPACIEVANNQSSASQGRNNIIYDKIEKKLLSFFLSKVNTH